MTRTSFKELTNALYLIFIWEERISFDFLPSFCWSSCQESTVIGLLLRH